MSNRKIQRLTVRCTKLKDALRKASNELAAAQRTAARRETRRDERRCQALGAAIEAAITHRWSAQQIRSFLDAVIHAYPANAASRSLRGITEAGWISYGAIRTRRMHWAITARGMLHSQRMRLEELEFIVRSYLQPPQQGDALAAIAAIASDLGGAVPQSIDSKD